MVGKQFSDWGGLFSGAMSVSGRVFHTKNDLKPNHKGGIFEGQSHPVQPPDGCQDLSIECEPVHENEWSQGCVEKKPLYCISILVSFIMSGFLEVVTLSIQIRTLKIQFISGHKPLKNTSICLFCHTYLSQLFLMYQPRYTNLHLSLFSGSPTLEHQEVPPAKRNQGPWGRQYHAMDTVSIDLGQIGNCINEWVEITSTRWSISVMTPFFT